MVELLKQAQYHPFPVEEQIVSIFAGTRGFLDDLAIDRVPDFEDELLKHMRNEHPEILDEIRESGALSDELVTRLERVIAHLKDRFLNPKSEE
jgi:F-type H+-transporting ATPase subunit alpha